MSGKYFDNPDKWLGGSMRGKCVTCGLSTSLGVHENCGERNPNNKKPSYKINHQRVYKESECKNLDCLKKYTPHSNSQKLCHECREKYGKS